MRLLAQNRKILAKRAPVHLARDSFMHSVICYTASCAPPLFTYAIAIPREGEESVMNEWAMLRDPSTPLRFAQDDELRNS
jgi:hypothetical protein